MHTPYKRRGSGTPAHGLCGQDSSRALAFPSPEARSSHADPPELGFQSPVSGQFYCIPGYAQSAPAMLVHSVIHTGRTWKGLCACGKPPFIVCFTSLLRNPCVAKVKCKLGPPYIISLPTNLASSLLSSTVKRFTRKQLGMKEKNKSSGKNPSSGLQCAPRQCQFGDSGGAVLCSWAARSFELVRTGYQ